MDLWGHGSHLIAVITPMPCAAVNFAECIFFAVFLYGSLSCIFLCRVLFQKFAVFTYFAVYFLSYTRQRLSLPCSGAFDTRQRRVYTAATFFPVVCVAFW